MTRKREIILELVNKSKKHLTAEQIFLEAKALMEKEGENSISMATVYNSLNYLEENGYIRRLKIRGNVDCFDSLFIPHEHMICDKCGKVEDFIVEDLNSLLSEKIGEDIISSELSVHYICSECR